MKKPFINKIPNILFFLFLFLFCLTIVGIIIGNKTPVAKDEFPPFSGLVVDEANIFTQRQKEELENILMQAAPYQVVAVSLNSLRNKEIEEYSLDLARHWGIGNKERNDGILISIAPHQRQMRIETGYGAESILTDAKSSQIIQNIMLPLAKREKYAQSLIEGSKAVVKVLKGENIDTNTEIKDINQLFDYLVNKQEIKEQLAKPKSIKNGNIIGIIFVLSLLMSIFFPLTINTVRANTRHLPDKEEYETDSHQNRVLFFYENVFVNTIMINFIPALISLITGSLSLYFMILVILVVVIHIPTYKRWKRNPKFPYKRQLLTDYRYDKKRKTWVSSSSHSSGSHHSSHSSGHRGGGGSFGGGGSSGRW